MGFCTSCGQRLEEGLKFCTSCGAPTDGSGPPPQNSQFVPEAGVADALASEGFATAKNLFSKSPTNAVAKAARTKSPIWILWGVLFVVVRVLFQLRKSYLDMWNFEMSAQVVVNGAIGAVLAFFVFVLSVKAVYMIFRIKIPFPKILNMTSVALLVFSLVMAVTALLTFLPEWLAISFGQGWLTLGGWLGWIGSMVMIFQGMRKLTRFNFNSFLLYFSLVAAVNLWLLHMVSSL